MSKVDDILTEIQARIAPSDDTLAAARERRNKVISAAESYSGVLRTYCSGSLAHKTANDDTDADCGVVLDRRIYPDLGPDGNNVTADEVVEEIRCLIRESLKDEYPNISFRLTKRAIKITFNEQTVSGTDPSVDLIVALTRKESALWIPNLEKKCWDASDPEYHTRVLTAEPADLRRNRAKAIRLAKAWNRQYGQPGLCSFNIEALALKAVQPGDSVSVGLKKLLKFAVDDLGKHLTPDPAGVSAAIKTLVDRDIAVKRLSEASQALNTAFQCEEDDAVLDNMANLFWKYVEPPRKSLSKTAFANTLRMGNAGIIPVLGGVTLGTGASALKTTRAFGGEDH